MLSRKTLILSVALAVAVTVPAVARAAAGPFDADPQPPTVGGEAETDAPYGWMGQMHDYMWNNGELPEDFPADAADWMNQMHDTCGVTLPQTDRTGGWARCTTTCGVTLPQTDRTGGWARCTTTCGVVAARPLRSTPEAGVPTIRCRPIRTPEVPLRFSRFLVLVGAGAGCGVAGSGPGPPRVYDRRPSRVLPLWVGVC